MRWRFAAVAGLALAAVALLLPASALGVAQIGDSSDGLADLDVRVTSIAPTAAQEDMAASLGATSVSWNRFGTPQSLVKHGGYLARGIEAANAVGAARAFLTDNLALFRLEGLDGLELYRDSLLAGNVGHAVTFRQTFGGLAAGTDGLVTVGVKGSASAGWDVAYVSSSLTGETGLSGGAEISAKDAWLRAARNAHVNVSASDVIAIKDNPGWQTFAADGLMGAQNVRAAAFPTVRGGAVPAFEALVVDVNKMIGYRTFVDARDGSILARYDVTHNASDGQGLTGGSGGQTSSLVETFAFSGEVPTVEAACGPMHGPYVVGPGVRALDGFAAAANPLNDMVLYLFRDGVEVLHADTLFSPEQFHYEPAGGVPPGNYTVQVCDFDNAGTPSDPDTPWSEPNEYSGTLTIDDTPAPAPYIARWKVFPNSPPLPPLEQDPWNHPSTDTRQIWCWVQATGCDYVVGNLASRVPWDYNAKTRTPTFTTMGNNARTATSWVNDLLPSPPQYSPTSPGRDYSFPWTNSWNQTDCARVANPVPGAVWDDAAAVTNLFVAHNRMHDWAYHLGFTERNWNAQDFNFGMTDIAFENDPIIGDAQSGALTTTRDNANMITFPDGVASITNMYFWQPIAGFYAPCVDGDFGMDVIGHEYGHMIENRMEGKGSNRTGFHAGAMGESAGDLFGVEYLNSNGFGPVADEHPQSAGAYDTGNKLRAIRNYAMSMPYFGAAPAPSQQLTVNALNFSDIGYDVTETQVHADGEIWSATQYEIKQTLIEKYNAQFPYSDVGLRRACNDSGMPASSCPGNRRWIQLYFDMMLLAPANLSMLDGRDAMLAADVMRFGGANQRELWGVYAHRGFGVNSFTTNQCANEVPTGNPCAGAGHTTANIDTNPTPDFSSPHHASTTVTFDVRSRPGGGSIPARVYVGHYERDVSPIADTDPATTPPATDPPGRGWQGINLDNVADMIPGTYEFFVHAAGYGHHRFRETISGNNRQIIIQLPTNFASK
ncbi:MAG: M36 family metallopeptidase, partial [Actinomycetota bacterium]|nr:M36 family metallopeptidase [Actinomycetota bacterium]